MKTLALLTGCAACLLMAIALVNNVGNNSSNQTTFVSSDSSNDTVVKTANRDGDNDMREVRSFISQQSSYSSSSGYQQSSLNISANELRQPHILKINTSGAKLNGNIIIDGKVVRKLSSQQAEINLSPLLTVGEHKIEISGYYAPASSDVTIQLTGPGTSVTQQTSGNGNLNYVLNVSVQ